jgi:molybdenum cofactor cytidylyltransferase
MSEPTTFLSGIILAAGLSTRMGRPKLVLELGGRPLLQHVLDAAAESRLDEIVLVLNPIVADEILAAVTLPARCPVHVELNPFCFQGQSTSLQLGVHSIDRRATAAAVLLGDQPGVTSALIDRVAAEFLAWDTLALRPFWWGPGGNRVPGHPVFLARRMWPAIHELRGDEGARAIFRERGWPREVEIAGVPPADIDDAADYARAVDACAARR